MLKILQLLKEKNIIGEFYTDENSDSFNVGFVKYYDKNYFILQCISPSGTSDGYVCITIESIIKICYETAYLNKIKKLMKNNEMDRESINLSQGNLLDELLNYLMANRIICNIELIDSSDFSMCGFIKEVNECYILVECLNEYGKADGMAVAKIDEITSVLFGSQNELNLKALTN